MEVTAPTWMERLKRKLLLEPKPFAMKKEVNWKAIRKYALIGGGVALIAILLMPQHHAPTESFQENSESGATANAKMPADPAQDAWSQLQQGQSDFNSMPKSPNHVHSGGASGNSSNGDRSISMILVREGVDSKTQLPAGARLTIRLLGRAVVTGQAMPVIGVVTKDLLQESDLAIPQGAKIFGEASFNDGSERVLISWRAIQLPDGRERPLSATGVGLDGQIGIEGRVHSDAVKNAIGQTVTRFIGAYAEGSMQRGPLGSSEGGHENGLKNAIAETAKDRAEAWAEGMKKERKWIEIESGNESLAVLTQSFVFREPGATYGR